MYRQIATIQLVDCTGTPARAVIKDVLLEVDPCAPASRRYRIWYEREGFNDIGVAQCYAWWQLIHVEEDLEKLPGFSKPAKEAKIEKYKAILELERRMGELQTELRKLTK